MAEKAVVVISDPQALRNAAVDLQDAQGQVSYIEDPYAAAAGCHAIAVMTEWDLYRELDFEKIYKIMLKPAFIFDGRNILDHQRCFDIGFNVYPIGKPPLTRY
jgi:UDPglucose 6-dehydrogenase